MADAPAAGVSLRAELSGVWQTVTVQPSDPPDEVLELLQSVRSFDEWRDVALMYRLDGQVTAYVRVMEEAVKAVCFATNQAAAMRARLSLAGHYLQIWASTADPDDHEAAKAERSYREHREKCRQKDATHPWLRTLEIAENVVRTLRRPGGARVVDDARRADMMSHQDDIEKILGNDDDPRLTESIISQLRMLRGLCSVHLEQYADAWRLFAHVIEKVVTERVPNAARLGMAFCCLKLGDMANAVRCFRRAHECAPAGGSDDLRPLQGLAGVLTNPSSGTEQEMKEQMREGKAFTMQAMNRCNWRKGQDPLVFNMWASSHFFEAVHSASQDFEEIEKPKGSPLGAKWEQAEQEGGVAVKLVKVEEGGRMWPLYKRKAKLPPGGKGPWWDVEDNHQKPIVKINDEKITPELLAALTKGTPDVTKDMDSPVKLTFMSKGEYMRERARRVLRRVGTGKELALRRIRSEAHYKIGSMHHFEAFHETTPEEQNKKFELAQKAYKLSGKEDQGHLANYALLYRHSQLSLRKVNKEGQGLYDKGDLEGLYKVVHTLEHCNTLQPDNPDVLLLLAKLSVALFLSISDSNLVTDTYEFRPLQRKPRRQGQGGAGTFGLSHAGVEVRSVSADPAKAARLQAGMRLVSVAWSVAREDGVEARHTTHVKTHQDVVRAFNDAPADRELFVTAVHSERERVKEDALRYLAQLTEVASPEDTEAWGLRGFLDKFEEVALPYFVEQRRSLAANDRAETADFVNNIGVMYLRDIGKAGALDAAEKQFEKAEKILDLDRERHGEEDGDAADTPPEVVNVNRCVVLYNQAVLKERRGLLEHAEELHQQVLESFPDFVDSHLALTSLLLRRGLHRRALAAATAAAELLAAGGDAAAAGAPGAALPKLQLSSMFCRLGFTEQARKLAREVEAALIQDVDSSAAKDLRLLAVLLEGNCWFVDATCGAGGDEQAEGENTSLARAESAFLRVLSEDSDNSYAAHNLACCLASRPPQRQQRGGPTTVDLADLLLTRTLEAVPPAHSAISDTCAYNIAQLAFTAGKSATAAPLYASLLGKLEGDSELRHVLPDATDISAKLAHCHAQLNEYSLAAEEFGAVYRARPASSLAGVNTALAQMGHVMQDFLSGRIDSKEAGEVAKLELHSAIELLIGVQADLRRGARHDRERRRDLESYADRIQMHIHKASECMRTIEAEVAAIVRQRRAFVEQREHFEKVAREEKAKRDEQEQAALRKRRGEEAREREKAGEQEARLNEVIEAVRAQAQAVEGAAVAKGRAAAAPARGLGDHVLQRPSDEVAGSDQRREERGAEDLGDGADSDDSREEGEKMPVLKPTRSGRKRQRGDEPVTAAELAAAAEDDEEDDPDYDSKEGDDESGESEESELFRRSKRKKLGDHVLGEEEKSKSASKKEKKKKKKKDKKKDKKKKKKKKDKD